MKDKNKQYIHEGPLFLHASSIPGQIRNRHKCTGNHQHTDDNTHICCGHHHVGDIAHTSCGHKHADGSGHACAGHQHERHWLKAAIGISFGGLMLALSLAGIAMPTTWIFISVGIAINVLITIYLGINIFQESFRALRKKQLSHTMLYTISSITLITVVIVSVFVPGILILGETAAMILGFWHLGEAIEHSLIDKLEENLDIRDCLPKKVLRNNELVAIEELIQGDIITINAGDIIPVDGEIIGQALLNPRRVSGVDKYKRFGDRGDNKYILSGMQVSKDGSPVTIRVGKTYAESDLSIKAEITRKGQQEKAELEIITKRILKYFTPMVLGLAILSGILIGSIFSPMLGLQCFIAVLVSTCPCVPSIVNPMTVKLAKKKTADIGVILRDGKAMERAAKVSVVLFDLNGTLTEGKHQVTRFDVEKDYIAHLAFIEKNSTHYIGEAIYAEASQESEYALEIADAEYTVEPDPCGIKAQIGEDEFIVGNADFLRRHAVNYFPERFNNPVNGQTYYVVNGRVVGQIKVNDKLRPEVPYVFAALRRRNIKVKIATGDTLESAREYLADYGVASEDIYANSSAQGRSKTKFIEDLKSAKEVVAMVGDSQNDAPAVSCADVGFAMRSPSADIETQNVASFVLNKNDLSPIVQTIEISALAKKTIIINLAISLGYNIAITLIAGGIFVALGLTLNPVIGVALMIVESAIVMGILLAFKFSKVQAAKPDSSAMQNKFRLFNCTGDIQHDSEVCDQDLNIDCANLSLS